MFRFFVIFYYLTKLRNIHKACRSVRDDRARGLNKRAVQPPRTTREVRLNDAGQLLLRRSAALVNLACRIQSEFEALAPPRC